MNTLREKRHHADKDTKRIWAEEGRIIMCAMGGIGRLRVSQEFNARRKFFLEKKNKKEALSDSTETERVIHDFVSRRRRESKGM